MKLGSLFSGIGGLELGLEMALRASGIPVEVCWQVEAEAFCRGVLARHWPEARRYEDVREVGEELERVDIVCFGWPCQDISNAGKGAGLDGARSGLFFEAARCLRLVRPRWIVLENVSAVSARGLGRVLGELAEIGYDARWGMLRASDVGAPHRRERFFLIGELADSRCRSVQLLGESGELRREKSSTEGEGHQREWRWPRSICGGEEDQATESQTQPGVGRVADGLPAWMDRWPAGPGQPQHSWEEPRTRPRQRGDRDRLKALGNAVVPACSYVIGLHLAAAIQRDGLLDA